MMDILKNKRLVTTAVIIFIISLIFPVSTEKVGSLYESEFGWMFPFLIFRNSSIGEQSNFFTLASSNFFIDFLSLIGAIVTCFLLSYLINYFYDKLKEGRKSKKLN
ncbi:hypothetical protein PTI45_04655 [Paenibacillus nuruki]|uniref:Uncharacterized protein n=1 Tax=Paenibacillus nuruki TaxID=1886670 RepID=A0A1E3KWV3_9BACL|nr:hypothetical protein PTI45_04655 [Paenibacillus nuruki]